jgi:dienelactone hydrolase
MNGWRRAWLATLVLAAGTLVISAQGRAGDPQRGEIIPIHTTTFTDEEFLSGKPGVSAVVAGELRFPAGSSETDRSAVIILVHGSGGIGPGLYQWSREFNEMGIATFMLDGFSGRGIENTREEQGQLGMLAMLPDAYRALEMLSKHRRIDPTRIAIMGGSRGAPAAMYTALRRFQRMHGPKGASFAAHIVFYGSCQTTYLDDLDVSGAPMRFFHGTADQAVASCQSYAEALRRAGQDVEFHEYAGAHHAFAEPVGAQLLAQAQSRRDCQLEERAGGVLVNRATNRPFTWNDACVRRGVTFEPNASARADAADRIKRLLGSLFNLGK